MNPLFGTNWSEWALSIVGGVIVLIISGFITRLYKRIEALEAALPARMETYRKDQEQHRDRLDGQLQDLRLTINAHGIQLSALQARMDKK